MKPVFGGDIKTRFFENLSFDVVKKVFCVVSVPAWEADISAEFVFGVGCSFEEEEFSVELYGFEV